MRGIFVFSVVVAMCWAPASYAQDNANAGVRDAQAVSILTRDLSQAGGSTAIAAISDYSATGNIVFYWAGEEVKGTVNVAARGTSQFRLDSSLSDGEHSITANNGVGWTKDPDGKTTTLALPIALNLGSATLPLVQIGLALEDAASSISYVGLSTYQGEKVQDVRVVRWLFAQDSTSENSHNRTEKHFLIDPGTDMVVAVRDQAYAKDGFGPDRPHEFAFGDYRSVGGVLVPFSIKDVIDGQVTMTVQLDQISFNTGLGDVSFAQ